MSCKANERRITFEEGCWTFHPNSLYHTMMLLYTQEEHVSCQCTFGSRLHEAREKVNSLCECSEGSFLTLFDLNLTTMQGKMGDILMTMPAALLCTGLAKHLGLQFTSTVHLPCHVSETVGFILVPLLILAGGKTYVMS